MSRNRIPHCEKLSRRGATLVELLAAIILATLLTVPVLGVLKSMTQSREALLADVKDEPWHGRLVEQLEWDLRNSQVYQTTPAGFRLKGFAGRDSRSGAPLHRPTTVEYLVDVTMETPVLLRREILEDALRLDNRTVEVIALDVERIMLGAAEELKRDGDLPTISPIVAISEETPLPDRVTVLLIRKNETTPLFEKSFFLR